MEDGPDFGEHEVEEVKTPKPRTLPADLPKSLDDRVLVNHFASETEYYDGWQGGWAYGCLIHG